MGARRWRTAAKLVVLVWPYMFFAALRHVVSLQTLVGLAWQSARTPRPRAEDEGVARLVTRLSRLVGAEADCLPCSLVLYRELSKRGANPQLMIGFAHDARPLIGHAWVVVDGRAVNESPSTLAALTPVCAFGAEGTRCLPFLVDAVIEPSCAPQPHRLR